MFRRLYSYGISGTPTASVQVGSDGSINIYTRLNSWLSEARRPTYRRHKFVQYIFIVLYDYITAKPMLLILFAGCKSDNV